MNKKFRLGLGLSVLACAAVMVLSSGSALPYQVAHAAGPDRAKAAVPWDTDGNRGNNKRFLGTTNNKPLVIKTNNTEHIRILPDGKVGVGTNAPAQTLQVNGITSLGAPGSVYGYLVDDGNQGLFPTLGFNAYSAPNYNAGANGFGGVMQFQNKDGALKYYTGPNVNVGQPRVFTERLVVQNDGDIGMGIPDPQHTLEVGGTFMVVEPGGGLYTLFANSDRTVSVGALAESTTKHLCYFGTYTISSCSSAAEYVPSIDAGKGFPETADLVSIVPDLKNLYGDAHGPFTVQKSLKACDSNLLGYIVKPESGADGVNLNEHYMPLAIYGYFPAKVTVENGPIKRGDPITSSSKAGYGMKATDACKVIGYALEDATAEGKIQVFANFGDNSAAQVTKLQNENDALKKGLLAIESRLVVLEVNTPAAVQQTAAR